MPLMKASSKVVHQKKCKNFCNQKSELPKENFNANSLQQFIDICSNVLNEHASQKENIEQGNHSPFLVNEEMSKENKNLEMQIP